MAEHELSTSDEFAALIRQMHQAAENVMGKRFFGFSPTDAWQPSVNLYETVDCFLVCVDLGGMTREEIHVQYDDAPEGQASRGAGVLLIRGRRQSPLHPDGDRPVAVHLMEIDHGSFCRLVEIPSEINAEEITAVYHQGMLWVRLIKLKA